MFFNTQECESFWRRTRPMSMCSPRSFRRSADLGAAPTVPAARTRGKFAGTIGVPMVGRPDIARWTGPRTLSNICGVASTLRAMCVFFACLFCIGHLSVKRNDATYWKHSIFVRSPFISTLTLPVEHKHATFVFSPQACDLRLCLMYRKHVITSALHAYCTVVYCFSIFSWIFSSTILNVKFTFAFGRTTCLRRSVDTWLCPYRRYWKAFLACHKTSAWFPYSSLQLSTFF